MPCLLIQCAYPDYGARKTIEDLISGRMDERTKANTPKPLLAAAPHQLRKAAAIIEGAEWKKALRVFRPDDEAGMDPLFSAIAHGCAAERENETWNEVYRARIARGDEAFASKQLGLFGQVLAALASFFETPFTRPSPRLSRNRALALNEAGFHLSALGRLEDAAEPVRAAITEYESLRQVDFAARCAENLSELLVTIGRLPGEEGAVAAGAEAVSFADRSGNASERMGSRTAHAYALLQAGSIAFADALFREAEAQQQEMQPDIPRLYSILGYRYCGVLLARGRATEAAARATYGYDLAHGAGKDLLSEALDTLTQARAVLAAISPPALAPQDCAARSAEALAALRRANQEAYIVPGLLAHVEALWRCGDANAPAEPQREAESIAKRGPMPLLLADTYLLSARIQLSEMRIARARSYRDQAAALIEKHGYGRAVPELALLDAEIADAENAANRETTIAAAIKAIRGEPYHDERTRITIDGGWWGMLPRLEALVPADHPELANLRAARDAYNAERDAYLAAEDARGWEQEDRYLADPDFRRALNEALVSNGYKTLDETPLSEQRNDARNFLKHMRATQREEEPAPPEIPDALLDQILADPQARARIQQMLTRAGVDQPFDRMPREMQRQTLAAMMAAMQEAKEESEGERSNIASEAPEAKARPSPRPAESKKSGWRWPWQKH
jgi:hypothetical protein